MPLISEELSAEDFNKLTAEDLEGETLLRMKEGVVITAEMLAKLRETLNLVEQAPGLDASALIKRLEDIPSTRSSRSVTLEITDQMMQADVVAARDTLVAIGGRPLRPLNYEPGPWDPSTGRLEEYHVQTHWIEEAATCEPELARWKAFRAAQQAVREDQATFSKHEQQILDYRTKYGLGGPIILHLEPAQQEKLIEWKEYQVFQHRLLAKKERAREQSWQRLKKVEQELAMNTSHEPTREAVMIYTGWFRSDDAELRDWKAYLTWIEQQLPIIATEEIESAPDIARRRTLSQHDERPDRRCSIKSRTVLGPVHGSKIEKKLGSRTPRIQTSSPEIVKPFTGRHEHSPVPVPIRAVPKRSFRRSEPTMPNKVSGFRQSKVSKRGSRQMHTADGRGKPGLGKWRNKDGEAIAEFTPRRSLRIAGLLRKLQFLKSATV